MVILGSTYGLLGAGWCISCLFCADSEAKVVAGIGEPINAMVHVGLGGSGEGANIGEQRVVIGVRLNLGLRLQSPKMKTLTHIQLLTFAFFPFY